MSEITVIEAGGLRLSVRYLTSEDLGQFIALSSSVSWRLSFDELKIMHKADPQSFIGAFLDDGMLISHISLMRCDENVAYIGCFITSFPFRRRGIGDKMIRLAIELAGERTVILHAVAGTPAFYERYGFEVANIDVIHVRGRIDQSSLRQEQNADVSKQMVSSANVEAVLEFDRRLTATKRSPFLRDWLLSDKSYSLCAIDGDGNSAGYVVVRPDYVFGSPDHFKVCGFYARSVNVALELLNGVLKRLPDKSYVCAEFPDINEASSLTVFKTLGLNAIEDKLRMRLMVRRGKFPTVKWQDVYAINNSFNTYI